MSGAAMLDEIIAQSRQVCFIVSLGQKNPLNMESNTPHKHHSDLNGGMPDIFE